MGLSERPVPTGEDEFLRGLADELGLDPGQLPPDQLLLDEIGLDSLQILVVLAFVEELVGYELDESTMGTWTVGSLFEAHLMGSLEQ